MAPLNVIALVSGGKDSFFSLLHCLAHQHRIVALANLYPAAPRPSSSSGSHAGDGDETDLNSFMYQTVGHQVIPLHAEATDLPLFRHAIVGGALQQARDYDGSTAKTPARAAQQEAGAGAGGGGDDETESMVPLLKAVMAAHPEANAVCAGAILSTYQRTRVESVAVRLGLVPLAFLWKYPILPPPSSSWSSLTGHEDDDDGAKLLRDMASAGLEARVVKVASGGLDESFLWEDVASHRGVARLTRAMAMFAAESGVGGLPLQPDGAVLGEGGEFETLVVNGPRCLFKKRIVVDDVARRLVSEGGGAAWLSIDGARLEEQEQEQDAGGEDGAAWEPSALARSIRLLDDDFAAILASPLALDKAGDLDNKITTHQEPSSSWRYGCGHVGTLTPVDSRLEQWSVLAAHQASYAPSVREETQDIVDQIRARLSERSLAPSNIVSAVVVLRQISDFPTINNVYGALFAAPNPPSRVTISCGGQLLPADHNISVSLTVHSASRFPVDGGRDGLHVQSRSYWAPANIGPYSQAITLPLDGIFPQQAATAAANDDEGEDDITHLSRSPPSSFSRLVFIAGQIPLIPASMELPPCEAPGTEPGMFAMQAVLSLQHLWRIGVEMSVQWWSSAVVYIPRTSYSGASSMTTRAKAMVTSAAWTRMHQLPGNDGRDSEDNEDDEDDGGPDVWDRKYNPAFRGFSDGKNKKQGRRLPDWGVVDKPDGIDAEQQLSQPQGRERQIPPFFLAEVEELPRGSGAEWHAHLGLSGLAAASVAIRSWSSSDAETRQGGRQDQASTPWVTQQTLVAGLGGGNGVFAHTTVAIGAPGSASPGGDEKLSAETLSSVLHAALQRAPFTSGGHEMAARGRHPYLVYLDGNLVCIPGSGEYVSAIPCSSLWNQRGERLAVVALYRETWIAEAPGGR